MRFPVMRGVIDRRLLVNYAIDPDVLERLLPSPFRPNIIHGSGMAGICLIRLTEMRPSGLPAVVGVGSENAAHRIAVVWEEEGEQREGVFIPRRDTSSRLNTFVGGRFFPGVHHLACFSVNESGSGYRVGFESRDGKARVLVVGKEARKLPSGSLFSSVDEVSRFFENGSIGYSPTCDPLVFDGLQLRTRTWAVKPVDINEVRSTFFEDPTLFPPGTVRFDNALVMNRIEHEWSAVETMRGARLHEPLDHRDLRADG